MSNDPTPMKKVRVGDLDHEPEKTSEVDDVLDRMDGGHPGGLARRNDDGTLGAHPLDPRSGLSLCLPSDPSAAQREQAEREIARALAESDDG